MRVNYTVKLLLHLCLRITDFSAYVRKGRACSIAYLFLRNDGKADFFLYTQIGHKAFKKFIKRCCLFALIVAAKIFHFAKGLKESFNIQKFRKRKGRTHFRPAQSARYVLDSAKAGRAEPAGKHMRVRSAVHKALRFP